MGNLFFCFVFLLLPLGHCHCEHHLKSTAYLSMGIMCRSSDDCFQQHKTSCDLSPSQTDVMAMTMTSLYSNALQSPDILLSCQYESKDLIIKLNLTELNKVKQVYLTKLRIAYPPKRTLQLIVADVPHLCLHEDISVVMEQSASPG